MIPYLRWGVMRCLVCGAEMQLLEVIPDNTMPVSCYEQQAFKCPGCHDVERRLVRREQPPRAQPSVSACKTCDEPVASVTAWARAVTKLRNHQAALQQRAALVEVSREVQREFNRMWDGFTPSIGKTTSPANLSTPTNQQPSRPQQSAPAHSAALLDALTDVIAKFCVSQTLSTAQHRSERSRA